MKNFKQGDRSGKQSGRRDFGNGGGEFSRRDSDRPTMHKAICNKCGQECEVPFKPTGDRPVFCNNCFEKPDRANSGGFREKNHQRSDFGDKRRYEAVCAKCGKKCEVPFQPTAGKPVYCNQCFEKEKNTRGKGPDQFKQQFEILNAKLDKILNALTPGASSAAAKELKNIKETAKAIKPKKSQIKTKPAPKKTKKKNRVKKIIL